MRPGFVGIVLFALASPGAILLGCASGTCPPPEPAPESPAPERLAAGAAAFQTGMCFKCHGDDGSGTPRGPNLTDDVWDHCDGSTEGILAVLERGVPKHELKDPSRPFGMNPASNLIPDPDTRRALAEYVRSLSRG
jgi:mono/diheme cytochrome c family protein